MNYGIKFYGQHAIIKLRCNVTPEDRDRIREQYPDLHVYHTGRRTAIEGCLRASEYHGFKKYVDDCTISYKIAELEHKRAKLWASEGAFIMDIDDDLPF